jgi:hypothetical protein
MKRTMPWMLCLLAASLYAQGTPAPKYKVATAAREEEIVPLLNGLAEQGYRLIVAGPAMILQLEDQTSEHYRYDSVPSTFNPEKFFKKLNEQAEQGYRWVERWTGRPREGPLSSTPWERATSLA